MHPRHEGIPAPYGESDDYAQNRRVNGRHRDAYEGGCNYQVTGASGPALIVNVFPVPYTARGPYFSGQPSAADGIGHPAACGPGLAEPVNLVAEIDSSHTLEIEGPSCGVDRKIARQAYSRLAG
jgi:hypothetical protein